MWQEVELLHSLLSFHLEVLQKPLMGDMQATGDGGRVRTQSVNLNPGGDWTSERPLKSTMSESQTERIAALTDSMELRSASEILDRTMETATRGILKIFTF